MAWNGSGTYTPPAASFPEVTGTTVDATRFNATINDLAAGITAALAKNGENAASANLPMGGFKHTAAADATAAGEYLVFNQASAKLAGLGVGVAASAWSGTSVYAVDVGPQAAYASNATGPLLCGNSYFDGGNHRAKATAAGCLLGLADGGLLFYTLASVSAGAVQTLTERLRITPTTGTVRVGASAPTTSYTFNVVGAGAFGSTAGAAVQLFNSTTGRAATLQCDDSENLTIHNSDTGSGAIVFKRSTGTGVESLQIDGSGNFIPTINTAAPALSATRQMVFSLTSNTNLRVSVRGSDGTTRVANITLA